MYYTFLRLSISLLICCLCVSEGNGEGLPPEEASIKNDVDHWGLAFSDQIEVFKSNYQRFAEDTRTDDPDYVLGVETSIRKTFKNKYWFKGKMCNVVELQAGRNESEAFQLAIIPKTGFALKDVNVSASPLKNTEAKATIPCEAVKLFRVGFVQTVQPQYPTKHIGEWPDPLLGLEPFSIEGLDLGLLWCEVKVPGDAAAGDYLGTITVTPANSQPLTLTIKLHVWDFTLPDRVDLPTMVWIKGDMASDDYRDVCRLFLEHHVDPLSVGKTNDLDLLDRNVEFCLDRGLMRFETPGFNKPEEFRTYYDHLKEKGWLDKALIYGAVDEPSEKQLREAVVPKTNLIHKEFPGLQVFLASQYYDGLDAGVDVWLTDVSTNFHSWLAAGRPGKQQLWWYVCHLPIRVNLERPLIEAPNVQIDNDALEHRLLYWMVWHYDIKGMFFWAGNMSWPTDLTLSKTKSPFPYAGIHNGNGFLVYPGPLPSIRLKVLRDGIEDYWYVKKVAELARSGAYSSEAKMLLDGITPAIFVDTHYFNRNVETMIGYRKKLGDFIEKSNR